MLARALARLRRIGRRRRGRDLFYDIRHAYPHFSAGSVFDIGANIGQSMLVYVRQFPDAKIYCFEPVESSFQNLVKCARGLPVQVHRTAMGSRCGPAKIHVDQDSTLSAVTEIDEQGVESIEMITVDEFCTHHRVDRISFMKVDTEGYDLEVLKGADSMLSAGKIDIVETEAGMNPENRRHVPLETIKKFMEVKGYRLFGLYQQVPEWPTGGKNLRRANVVFVAPHMIA